MNPQDALNNNNTQQVMELGDLENTQPSFDGRRLTSDEEDDNYHSLPPVDSLKESQFPYISMESSNNDGGSAGGMQIKGMTTESHECSTVLSNDSSFLTADEIADPVGFYIICMVTLIGDMARGVMFPTLWPLIQTLGGSEVTQGYAVAAFSFGRILASPIFGSWSVTNGYQSTLLISCSILLVGTLLYAQAENVGTVDFLVFAQMVMGVGSGTLGVTRAFVADVSPHRNRTTYISWLTAVQYGGFTVTPFVGAILEKFFSSGGDRDISLGIFRLDKYTSPAYFMSLSCMVTLALLYFVFHDRQRDVGTAKKKKKKTSPEVEDVANSLTCFGFLTVYDACLMGCMLLNIATKGSIAVYETLGVAIADSHFGMRSSQAGFIVGTCGALGVISLLCMGYIAKYLTDIQIISYGMMVTALGAVSFVTLEEEVYNPLWRYVVAIFMIYSVGYPIGHTAVIGLFSKIVGRKPQGTLQGMFASAGSLARIMFPIASGYIMEYVGTTTLFLIITSVLAIAALIVTANRTTLEKLSS